jgi:hypothetical protein
MRSYIVVLIFILSSCEQERHKQIDSSPFSEDTPKIKKAIQVVPPENLEPDTFDMFENDHFNMPKDTYLWPKVKEVLSATTKSTLDYTNKTVQFVRNNPEYVYYPVGAAAVLAGGYTLAASLAAYLLTAPPITLPPIMPPPIAPPPIMPPPIMPPPIMPPPIMPPPIAPPPIAPPPIMPPPIMPPPIMPPPIMPPPIAPPPIMPPPIMPPPIAPPPIAPPQVDATLSTNSILYTIFGSAIAAWGMPKFNKYIKKITPVTPEPPKAEPPKAEPPKAEPPKAEPPKAEPPKAEPPKAEPPKAEPPKAEPTIFESVDEETINNILKIEIENIYTAVTTEIGLWILTMQIAQRYLDSKNDETRLDRIKIQHKNIVGEIEIIDEKIKNVDRSTKVAKFLIDCYEKVKHRYVGPLNNLNKTIKEIQCDLHTSYLPLEFVKRNLEDMQNSQEWKRWWQDTSTLKDLVDQERYIVVTILQNFFLESVLSVILKDLTKQRVKLVSATNEGDENIKSTTIKLTNELLAIKEIRNQLENERTKLTPRDTKIPKFMFSTESLNQEEEEQQKEEEEEEQPLRRNKGKGKVVEENDYTGVD